MNVGDLVRDTMVGEGNGNLGLVMEEEKYEGQIGTWVWYFQDQEDWRWYSFDERYDVEVISESH